MGREVEGDLDGLRVGERERAGWDDVVGCSSGRGKKKESGLKENLDRSGGLRTLRYILNDLSARFACGTYLVGKFFRQLDNCDGIGWTSSLISVCNFFRVHPTRKEKNERCYAHEQETTGEICM